MELDLSEIYLDHLPDYLERPHGPETLHSCMRVARLADSSIEPALVATPHQLTRALALVLTQPCIVVGGL